MSRSEKGVELCHYRLNAVIAQINDEAAARN